jgi:beta-lactamase class A
MTTARDLVPISPHPELPFEERIAALERSFSGRLGYHAVHLEQRSELALREEEPFPTASVIKVALA